MLFWNATTNTCTQNTYRPYLVPIKYAPQIYSMCFESGGRLRFFCQTIQKASAVDQSTYRLCMTDTKLYCLVTESRLFDVYGPIFMHIYVVGSEKTYVRYSKLRSGHLMSPPVECAYAASVKWSIAVLVLSCKTCTVSDVWRLKIATFPLHSHLTLCSRWSSRISGWILSRNN